MYILHLHGYEYRKLTNLVILIQRILLEEVCEDKYSSKSNIHSMVSSCWLQVTCQVEHSKLSFNKSKQLLKIIRIYYMIN